MYIEKVNNCLRSHQLNFFKEKAHKYHRAYSALQVIWVFQNFVQISLKQLSFLKSKI